MLSQSLAAKSRAFKRSVQRGVTLIELSVVIVILSLLAFALYQFADPGGRGKAVALLSYMTEVSNSAQRFKTDTGCYSTQVRDLYTQPLAAGIATTFCGTIITQNAWNGPYLKPGTTVANCVAVDKLASGAQICISTDATNANPGVRTNYILKAVNIPGELAAQLLKECNGVEPALNPNFAAGKCRVGTPSAGGTADAAGGTLPTSNLVATIDMLFDTTR